MFAQSCCINNRTKLQKIADNLPSRRRKKCAAKNLLRGRMHHKEVFQDKITLRHILRGIRLANKLADINTYKD